MPPNQSTLLPIPPDNDQNSFGSLYLTPVGSFQKRDFVRVSVEGTITATDTNNCGTQSSAGTFNAWGNPENGEFSVDRHTPASHSAHGEGRPLSSLHGREIRTPSERDRHLIAGLLEGQGVHLS